MPLCLTPRIESIAQSVTGRSAPFFAADIAAQAHTLSDAILGRRILVAGGAGSIGSATLLALLEFQPAAVHVLDPAENNLAELVRSVRTNAHEFKGEFAVQPLDYGSNLAAGYLSTQSPFDVVLSFAALKHVRSERDEFSLARMLEVNLTKADRFLATLRRQGHGNEGVFLVSTDKAANPVSLMGASKRAMELLLWAHATPGSPASILDGGIAPSLPRITTTRFANVAFSDGSLPWSFLQRLEKNQPLAAPGDIRRYLVSPVEAGQLCLLAAFVAPHHHVLVPTLDPEKDLVKFTDIAEHTLRSFGLTPEWHRDEATAKAAVEGARERGRWPVLVTHSDTSGEKDIEEFIGKDEYAIDCELASCRAVAGKAPQRQALGGFLQLVDRACVTGLPPAKAELVTALGKLIPMLHHQETGKSLDQKM